MLGYGPVFAEGVYDMLACDLKRYLDWQIDARLPTPTTPESVTPQIEGVLTSQDLFMLEDMVTQVVQRALEPIYEKLGIEPQ